MKTRNILALLTIFFLIGVTNCDCSVIRAADENIDQKRLVKAGSNAPGTYKVAPLQFDFQLDASDLDSTGSDSDSDEGGFYADDVLKEWKECDDIPSAEILSKSTGDHINNQGKGDN
jgi:hypothetical protein